MKTHIQLFLTLIALMQFPLLSQAQNLFLDTWYVQSITESDITYVAPKTIDMPFVKLEPISDNMIITEMCASGFTCNISYKDNDRFSVHNFNAMENTCTESNSQSFYQQVIDFFQGNIEGDFIYHITAYDRIPSETTVEIIAIDGSKLCATNFPYGIPPQVWLQNPTLKKIVWQGTEWIAPNNNEVSNIHLKFNTDNPAFDTHTCNMASLTGFADFNLEGTEVAFRELTIYDGACNSDENVNFTNAYFQLLRTRENHPFSISSTILPNNSMQLTLEDENNNQLVFETELLSIDEVTAEDIVSIYPNPAQDVIHWRYQIKNSLYPSAISIYNLQGKLIQEWSLSKIDMQNGNIDVRQLPNGIYAMVWRCGSSTIVKKVRIQH